MALVLSHPFLANAVTGEMGYDMAKTNSVFERLIPRRCLLLLLGQRVERNRLNDDGA